MEGDNASPFGTLRGRVLSRLTPKEASQSWESPGPENHSRGLDGDPRLRSGQGFELEEDSESRSQAARGKPDVEIWGFAL